MRNRANHCTGPLGRLLSLAFLVCLAASCRKTTALSESLPTLGAGPEYRFAPVGTEVKQVASASVPPLVAVAWVADRLAVPAVHFAVSTDNGASFRGPLVVASLPAAATSSVDARLEVAATRSDGSTSTEFLLRWRADRGVTTVAHVRVGADGAAQVQPATDLASVEEPTATCQGDGSVLWSARSTPGHATPVNHAVPELSCVPGDVAATVDPRGWVHVVWVGGPPTGGARRVFYASSADGVWFGAAQPLDVDDDAQVSDVRVTIDPNETVVATWTRGEPPNSSVLMRQVIPAHHGPGQLLPLTTIDATGAADRSTVTPIRGGVIVAWRHNGAAQSTVAFRRVGLDALCGPEVSTPATATVASTALPAVEVGRDLYAENGCATCHGAEGHGDGPVGKTLAPTPRDFRDGAAFKAGRDEGAIARTIAQGFNQAGSKMPAFGHLSEQERRSLALFVISLRDRN